MEEHNKMKERKMQDQVAGVENAGPKNVAPENQDQKMDQRPEAVLLTMQL